MERKLTGGGGSQGPRRLEESALVWVLLRVGSRIVCANTKYTIHEVTLKLTKQNAMRGCTIINDNPSYES